MYNILKVKCMAIVKIEKLDHQFRGIGYLDGKVLFVPRTIPKEMCDVDILDIKKNYMVGECKRILERSSKRVTPKCPFYDACGGCDMEHISYEESVLWKKQMLEEIFKKNGLWNDSISVISDQSGAYRNKVSLKVQNGRLGFYQNDTHQLVEISKCLLASDAINRLIDDFLLYSFPNGEVMIRVNENDEVLLDIITNDEVKIEAELTERHKIVGIMVNHRCVYGESYFFERKNGVLYQVSFDSFFQVNPFISSKLFLYVRDCLKKASNVLDLYCGVGTLGLQVYQNSMKLTGIEIVPNAIFNAMKNAKLNHVDASFHLGNVTDLISKIPVDFDAVIVDPPRSGLDTNTCKAIFDMKPDTILYVSCNPQTLIRDLKFFQKDYEIVSVQGFDMFPYAKHVECVSVMTRR